MQIRAPIDTKPHSLSTLSRYFAILDRGRRWSRRAEDRARSSFLRMTEVASSCLRCSGIPRGFLDATRPLHAGMTSEKHRRSDGGVARPPRFPERIAESHRDAARNRASRPIPPGREAQKLPFSHPSAFLMTPQIMRFAPHDTQKLPI